jgi:hypothetical protein
MDGALVWTNPAQLAVGSDMSPEPAHIFRDPTQIEPDDQMFHRPDGRAANLVAAPDRESQAVAFETRAVGSQDDIGRRIIRIGVHGVRTIQALRGWKAHVGHAHRLNGCHV